jgi:hypothetical protein
MPWVFCQARYSIHVPTQCSYEWFGKYLHHIAQEYKIPTFPTKPKRYLSGEGCKTLGNKLQVLCRASTTIGHDTVLIVVTKRKCDTGQIPTKLEVQS